MTNIARFSPSGVSLARLDFWAPGDMRDWVDREATRAGLHRSEFLRRMILAEMERAPIGSPGKQPKSPCNHPVDR